MSFATVTVTTKGRITIPAPVRKALGVGSGNRLAFVCTAAGCFEIAPVKNEKSIRALKGAGAKAGHNLSVDAMNQVIALRRARKMKREDRRPSAELHHMELTSSGGQGPTEPG